VIDVVSILNDIEKFVRNDFVVALVLGVTLVIFWKRVLPLLVLLVVAFIASRLNLQHVENAPPLTLLIGAVILGLAIVQAAVVLLFGHQAANGAIGYLVAALIMAVVKAPFVLTGRAFGGMWRMIRGQRSAVTRDPSA
jgi:hypothetical protein